MSLQQARRPLADIIAQRKAEHERQQRAQTRTRRGNRYERWHVPETPEREPENWLMTYLDLITLLLALLVVMLAFTRLNGTTLPADAPVTDARLTNERLTGERFAHGQAADERLADHITPTGLAAGLRLDKLPAAPVLGLPHDMPVIPAAWAQLRDDRLDVGVNGLGADGLVADASGQMAVAPTAPATPAAAQQQVSSTDAPPLIEPADASASEPAGTADSSIEALSPAAVASGADATGPSAAPAIATPPLAPPPSAESLGLTELGDAVDVIINSQSVSFRISNELLFPSGQAMLSPSGLDIIRKLAQVINRSPHPVSVEGHSDPVPIQNKQFPSNWELSAGRATAVLRELVRDGVAAGRLRAVGYADTRPLQGNDTPDGRAANRRVELIMRIAADAAPGQD